MSILSSIYSYFGKGGNDTQYSEIKKNDDLLEVFTSDFIMSLPDQSLLTSSRREVINELAQGVVSSLSTLTINSSNKEAVFSSIRNCAKYNKHFCTSLINSLSRLHNERNNEDQNLRGLIRRLNQDVKDRMLKDV